jgi:hypothetical protein
MKSREHVVVITTEKLWLIPSHRRIAFRLKRLSGPSNTDKVKRGMWFFSFFFLKSEIVVTNLVISRVNFFFFRKRKIWERLYGVNRWGGKRTSRSPYHRLVTWTLLVTTITGDGRLKLDAGEVAWDTAATSMEGSRHENYPNRYAKKSCKATFLLEAEVVTHRTDSVLTRRV